MDFVLVPGACHGGWWYAPLVDRLDALGHRVLAVTLDGLDPADLEPDRPITLDTHVRQLTAILAGLPGPAVVVGHSYAGSVIVGAADAVPDRFAALVAVDAFVPEDGDTCWSMTNGWQREWYVDGAARTGRYVDPLPFFDERAVAHPLATFLQRSRLRGAWRDVPRKHYVLAADAQWLPGSPFAPVAERLRADPSWTVHDLDVGHNVLRDGPDALLGVLTTVTAS